MRLIDADHLRRWILSRVFQTQLSVADVIDQIDREDTIEPERKKGEWIVYKAPNKYHCGLCKCPFCGYGMVAESDGYNYCPKCGADMRGEKDG